ncbi:MAG TPA: SDR family oxidoreductase [Syntrophales bacterium]|nr:SDR family oxidoreductase [Syntrophales bacterium]
MMDNVAWITGASSGFGAACARRLAAGGWGLILSARRADRLEGLRREIGDKAPVHILPLDVRDRQGVTAAVSGLPAAFRPVTLLVNNAGLALGLEKAHEADLEDWDRMVDTNIKGLIYMTRALLPQMVAADRGYIINIGSVAGNWPYPGGNVYGGTKAFVKRFSQNLRSELIGTAVRVTNIEPGLAETEFSLVRFKGDAEKAAAVYEGMKPLSAEDIAEIVWWLVNLPPHVNVNSLEVMPVAQAWSFFAVHRDT